jgi:hypothetical protein
MAKAARRYDLYLPLTYNDGRPIPDEHFDSVERRLLARFGGVTSQQRGFPLRGVWLGGTQLYLDQVIVMTSLDFRRSGGTRSSRSSALNASQLRPRAAQLILGELPTLLAFRPTARRENPEHLALIQGRHLPNQVEDLLFRQFKDRHDFPLTDPAPTSVYRFL